MNQNGSSYQESLNHEFQCKVSIADERKFDVKLENCSTEHDFVHQLKSQQHAESATTTSDATALRFLCDMGYGLPTESRPRKEKILAISRQLVNFMIWQSIACPIDQQRASVHIVGCSDPIVADALRNRIKDLWRAYLTKENNGVSHEPFPTNFLITDRSLESYYTRQDEVCITDEERKPDVVSSALDECSIMTSTTSIASASSVPVYLSPDADDKLNVLEPPPATVVIGMLIDRSTIQINRSRRRASILGIPVARWPLEDIAKNVDDNDDDTWHQHEPLNVDCILEGMQQWEWNWRMSVRSCNDVSDRSTDTAQAFENAALQALARHKQRHPGRPQHLKKKLL